MTPIGDRRLGGGGRFLLYRLPVLAYLALICYLSSRPVPGPGFLYAPDYILHGVEYCLLYLLMFWAVHEGTQVRKGRGGYWLPLLLTVLYGVSDEWHQSFVESRDASVRDVLADTIGGLVGVAMLVLRSMRRT